MHAHVALGEGIVVRIDEIASSAPAVRHHHERVDGHGYPDGLGGEDVPLPARIVFVADALDAITTDRPYRRGRSIVEALAEIEGNAGTQFCPRVVAALREIWQTRPDVLAAEEPTVAPPPRALRLLELPVQRAVA